MRILTRYLLRTHIGPFFFSLTVFTALLLINTVARQLENLAGKGLSASVIAEVFVLSVPHIIALTLPMAVLVAVLYAFSQLAADNEITALKASGVNLARLLLPLLAVGGLLTAGMLYFNDSVLPETNHRLRNLMLDIGRKSPTLQLKEQVVNPIQTSDRNSRYYLQAARIDAATNRLEDIVIYDLSASDQTRTIYADSGHMAFNAARTDLFLTLHDGVVHTLENNEEKQFQRLDFDYQVIRIAGVGNQLRRSAENQYRGDREMSLGQLMDEVEMRRADLENARQAAVAEATTALESVLAGPVAGATDLEPAEFDDGTPYPAGMGDGSWRRDATVLAATPELRTLADRVISLRRGVSQYLVEYHKKHAIPFACMIFVLIGAPLAVRFPRGGVGLVIAASLTVFSIYYMFLIGGEELADKGIIAPFWAMWAPNALFLLLGGWAVLRIGRGESTARGGGWDDLWNTVRGVLARPIRPSRQEA